MANVTDKNYIPIFSLEPPGLGDGSLLTLGLRLLPGRGAEVAAGEMLRAGSLWEGRGWLLLAGGVLEAKGEVGRLFVGERRPSPSLPESLDVSWSMSELYLGNSCYR